MEKDYTNDELRIALMTKGQIQNDALKWIYKQEKWRKSVDKIIMEKGGNANLSEEIFQQGIGIFSRKIVQSEFKGESSLLTFFIGICKNLYLKHIEKTDKSNGRIDMTSITNSSKAIDSGSPELNLMRQEQSDETKKLMRFLFSQLRENCKKILKMYSLKYSMKEIAKEMDFEKEQSAKNATFRCRERLRALVYANETIYQKAKEAYEKF